MPPEIKGLLYQFLCTTFAIAGVGLLIWIYQANVGKRRRGAFLRLNAATPDVCWFGGLGSIALWMAEIIVVWFLVGAEVLPRGSIFFTATPFIPVNGLIGAVGGWIYVLRCSAPKE